MIDVWVNPNITNNTLVGQENTLQNETERKLNSMRCVQAKAELARSFQNQLQEGPN
jgi:hypothetical protein